MEGTQTVVMTESLMGPEPDEYLFQEQPGKRDWIVFSGRRQVILIV